MDFDPGELYDEEYEDGFEDNEPEGTVEDVVEFDTMGNPIYLAAAAGFGYHMAQDEVDERQLAEDILKDKAGKVEPAKVPLAHRHKQEKKGHMTPFARWSTAANINHDKTKDEIEYTIEERLLIMESEGDWDG